MMLSAEDFASRHREQVQLKEQQRRLDAEALAATRKRRHNKGLLRRAQKEIASFTQAALTNRQGTRVARAVMTRVARGGFGRVFVYKSLSNLTDVVLCRRKSVTADFVRGLSTEFRAALVIWAEGAERQRMVNDDPWFDRMISMVACHETPQTTILPADQTEVAHTMMRVMALREVSDLNLFGVVLAYLFGPLLPLNTAHAREADDDVGVCRELDHLSGSLDLALAVLSWCWNVRGWLARTAARSTRHKTARKPTAALHAADLAQIVWGLLNPSGPALECVPSYLLKKKAPSRKRARE